MPLESDIDALFALPLAEFTAARNALATRLKKSGRAADAERVKSLSKPSATAWAVNQLYWQQRKDIDRLFALGEKVRKAQTGASADLRKLLDERRTMISALTNRAAEHLRSGGHADSQEARRRIAISLESLAAWGPANADPQPGRHTADLEPLGFDALAVLLDGKKLQPAKVLQFRRAAQEKKTEEDAASVRAKAREALKAAEKALSGTRREAERAEATLAKANARAEALEEQKREIVERSNQAREDARAADREARKAQQSVTEAERAVARARTALE